jgi:hypothetical protein
LEAFCERIVAEIGNTALNVFLIFAKALESEIQTVAKADEDPNFIDIEFENMPKFVPNTLTDKVPVVTR